MIEPYRTVLDIPARILALAILCVLTASVAVRADGLGHVMFCFVDHWEPIDGNEDAASHWVGDYMTMAARHKDADGRHPVHTYFVYWDNDAAEGKRNMRPYLHMLNEVAYKRFGEVELHIHHGMENEGTRSQVEATEDFISLVGKAKDVFSEYALVTAGPQPEQRFCFIHGMWALDNSRLNNWSKPGTPYRQYCGVNQEIRLLKDLGCYADMTFPAWGSMQPPLSDSIFYVRDDPQPKSYRFGDNIRRVEVGKGKFGDLMLVEGPSVDTNIGVAQGEYNAPATLERMRSWISHDVHVVGNDDWIFVKVYTHGCNGYKQGKQAWWNSFFGQQMDAFYSDIEATFNDGRNWSLHYVSAREMYNIIKAAEAGKTGDPNQYRDFEIPRYANSVIYSDNEYELVSYDRSETIVKILGSPSQVKMSFAEFSPHSSVYRRLSEDQAWESCGAVAASGEAGELRIIDERPSRFYRIVQERAEPRPSDWSSPWAVISIVSVLAISGIPATC